jgi:hypothetical protein
MPQRQPAAAPEALPEGAGVGTVQPRWPFPSRCPHWHFCVPDLRTGCYALTIVPFHGFFSYFVGTLRVDHDGSTAAISGDLYRYFRIFPGPFRGKEALAASVESLVRPAVWPFEADDVPAYPRNRYYSYLKVTGIQSGPVITTGPCQLCIVADEYVYTQPPAGSFNGSFPSSPNRTITLALASLGPDSYAGQVLQAGSPVGTVRMDWITDRFRNATLEIHTLSGAATPVDVPARTGVGNESFDSVYDTAGWDVEVVYDGTPVPVPAGVNPDQCWSDSELFNLLNSVLTAANSDLDAEWRFHLLVVPGSLGCGRGEMFDTSGSGVLAPREGAVSYSDDGYPTSDSAHFGSAANQEQRTIPRAFLRSASHEVGHGFNQQHQSLTFWGEPGSDNSIMTTTPEVADYLYSSGTGVFPDDINLGVNQHVRHHLIHFPDPVVRPGGMNFGAGHSTPVPQEDADRAEVGPDVLGLSVTAEAERIRLGQPLPVAWTLTNVSEQLVRLPSELGLAGQHVRISVTRPDGEIRRMPGVVVRTDGVALRELEPGGNRSGRADLFWSSQGFAFEHPGRHTITVSVIWNAQGVPYRVSATTSVWVDHPLDEADNRVAELLLHHEVGMAVALGGVPQAFEEGARRIGAIVDEHPGHPAAEYLRRLRTPGDG